MGLQKHLPPVGNLGSSAHPQKDPAFQSEGPRRAQALFPAHALQAPNVSWSHPTVYLSLLKLLLTWALLPPSLLQVSHDGLSHTLCPSSAPRAPTPSAFSLGSLSEAPSPPPPHTLPHPCHSFSRPQLEGLSGLEEAASEKFHTHPSPRSRAGRVPWTAKVPGAFPGRTIISPYCNFLFTPLSPLLIHQGQGCLSLTCFKCRHRNTNYVC